MRILWMIILIIWCLKRMMNMILQMKFKIPCDSELENDNVDEEKNLLKTKFKTIKIHRKKVRKLKQKKIIIVKYNILYNMNLF